jgi:hypothetical protein
MSFVALAMVLIHSAIYSVVREPWIEWQEFDLRRSKRAGTRPDTYTVVMVEVLCTRAQRQVPPYSSIDPPSDSVERDRHAYASQFSTLRAGTRLNSATLSVTHTASIARACAAINMSFAPMGVPFFSSAVRMAA